MASTAPAPEPPRWVHIGDESFDLWEVVAIQRPEPGHVLLALKSGHSRLWKFNDFQRANGLVRAIRSLIPGMAHSKACVIGPDLQPRPATAPHTHGDEKLTREQLYEALEVMATRQC